MLHSSVALAIIMPFGSYQPVSNLGGNESFGFSTCMAYDYMATYESVVCPFLKAQVGSKAELSY